jgi:thiol-disulfide isomerase/thioredoxin
MLYHYDCPDCQTAVPKLERMVRDLQGNEDFLRIVLIEVPPYGTEDFSPASQNNVCMFGKLDASSPSSLMM